MIGVRVEPELGARIASITDARGRERLWIRPDARRATVSPGDAFVDAGGAEEVFPTFEHPDHGDVWSRPWRASGDALEVRTDGARLSRRLDVDEGGFTARYELEAPPGYRFVWAFHLLLAAASWYIVRPEGATQALSWPGGHAAPASRDPWPRVGGERRFDRAGADDGTAVFALLPGVTRAVVSSPAGTVATTLTTEDDQPLALGIWRNLGGWPEGRPYRSWGVEPMIGRHPDRDRAGAEAGIARSGRLAWTLRVDIGDGAE